MICRVLVMAALVFTFSSCRSMSDIRPGEGRKETFTGYSYEQIFGAAEKVADEHFEIHQRDRVKGEIVAERTMTAWGSGAWVGIYITPPRDGAPAYVVEVVGKKKLATNVGEQDWEKKVLRDMTDVLAGRPMR